MLTLLSLATSLLVSLEAVLRVSEALSVVMSVSL